MMIQEDYTPLIRKKLDKEGYGPLGDVRIERIGRITLHGKDGDFVAVPSLIKIERSVDDSFEAMRKSLEKIKSMLGKYPMVIFQGSENGVVFPDWFESWLRSERVEIEIQSKEQILEDAKHLKLMKYESRHTFSQQNYGN